MRSLLNIKVSDSAVDVFKAQSLHGQGLHAFVVYKLDKNFKEISVDKTFDASATFPDLQNALPENEGRFITALVEYNEGENGHRNKTMLILYNPLSSPVKSRMLYASSIQCFKTALSNYGIGNTVESGNRFEITNEALVEKCRKFSA